jgi:hypothetical protein
MGRMSAGAFPYKFTVLCALGALLALASGCGTVKQSGTPRTGTEQILLTNAWDEALQQVDFRPLAGVPVYLETQYLKDSIDQGWIISSLRQAMLAQGVMLRSKPEQAEWIVEARIGAYGTDSYNWLVGVPQTTLPVAVAGLPTGTIPEIPFAKTSNQFAYAKLALFAFDRANGQMIWRSGTQLGDSNAKDVYVGGVGPIQSGTIRQNNKRIGINLPIISDPTPSVGMPGRSDAKESALTPPEFPGASMALPPSASDLKSFRP